MEIPKKPQKAVILAEHDRFHGTLFCIFTITASGKWGSRRMMRRFFAMPPPTDAAFAVFTATEASSLL